MPRIPIIEQTTNVSTTTPSPQAQGQQVVSPIGNAGAIAAEGFNQLAEANVREQNALWHKENADAVANTGKPLSDADVYWKQYLTDAPKNTVDGGMVRQDDGTTVGFRDKAGKDFDTWATDFMKPITNEKAKIYAQNHINQLRTQVLDNAITFEAQAGVANRSAKVDEAVQTWSSLAAKDDRNVSELITSAKTMIANSGFDERTRNEKAVQATKQIVESAITGNMERNPQATRAALLQRYGVDPTAPAYAPTVGDADAVTQTAQRLGISPVDLATVISYETGGKFSTSIRGGTNNRHIGLIQFGDEEQKTYGAKQGQSFGDQMQSVEKYLKDRGVKPGDNLSTLYKIVNGGNRDVSGSASDGNGTIDEHVARMQKEHATGAQKFLGTTNTTASSPAPQVAPQLSALIEQLPADRLPAYISHATTLVNQQQATVQSAVASTEADHVAAFMNGETIQKPLTLKDYQDAFGNIEGPGRFSNYQAIQQLGYDITSMKAMPPDQMSSLAEHYRPSPDAPDFALADKRYKTIQAAADKINTDRQADPMASAMNSKIGNAQPLDFTNDASFMKSLAARQGVAETMQSTYGAPYNLLTNAEVKTLNKNFETLPTKDRLGYLNAIRSSLTDPKAYMAVMQQIAPDSPVTAMAGIIMAKQNPMVVKNWISADQVFQQQDVAGLMIEGEALINPTKTAKGEDGKGKLFPMPKDQDLRQQFTNVVGNAFAGDPKGADFAYQGVKAYYAGKSAREGDIAGTINPSRMKDAITAVVGGVSNVNGRGDAIRPWGMDDGDFRNRAKTAFDQAIVANGYTDPQMTNYGAYGLRSWKDGKYVLQSATGYLVDKKGDPIVIDMTSRPSLIDQIPTNSDKPAGAMRRSFEPPATVVQEKTVKPITQLPKTQ